MGWDELPEWKKQYLRGYYHPQLKETDMHRRDFLAGIGAVAASAALPAVALPAAEPAPAAIDLNDLKFNVFDFDFTIPRPPGYIGEFFLIGLEDPAGETVSANFVTDADVSLKDGKVIVRVLMGPRGHSPNVQQSRVYFLVKGRLIEAENCGPNRYRAIDAGNTVVDPPWPTSITPENEQQVVCSAIYLIFATAPQKGGRQYLDIVGELANPSETPVSQRVTQLFKQQTP